MFDLFDLLVEGGLIAMAVSLRSVLGLIFFSEVERRSDFEFDWLLDFLLAVLFSFLLSALS